MADEFIGMRWQNVCGHGDVRIPARDVIMKMLQKSRVKSGKIWSGTDDNDIARKVLAYVPDDFFRKSS